MTVRNLSGFSRGFDFVFSSHSIGKSKSDLVLQLNAKESQRRSHAKKRRVEKRWSAKKPDAMPQKDQSSASTTAASLEAQQP
ncbi:hypothetical protein MRB53_017584 [Persea americana]|uniref:Uncharacterized protein n=1 Tax=Persea americana TaxID=3435 RepID=A0ACC2M5J0_PERAE|nr:hypothetical protein MRB53_017584 [Persea americana]